MKLFKIRGDSGWSSQTAYVVAEDAAHASIFFEDAYPRHTIAIITRCITGSVPLLIQKAASCSSQS